MRKLAIIAGLAAVGLGAQGTALAYSATATVTAAWGGTTAYGAATEAGWTSNGVNTISSIANSTYYSTLAGSNSVGYYNQDFASAAQCAALTATLGTAPITRKYGCRYTSFGYTPLFIATPVVDAGPAGGTAAGSLTVTDTTLTGTLTVTTSTDEPSGSGFVTILGARIGTGVGTGTDGYNIRSADGSPFGNYWNGITTSATLTFSLTGTFTATSWDITGGVVDFFDGGFLCQQGGFGGDGRGTLCTASGTGGGHQNDGQAQSWGMDPDGATTGFSTGSIAIKDAAGATTLSTLSGVLASLSLDGGGNITTNSGEYRRALGSAGGGCLDSVRYDGTKISCGTLTTASLSLSGVAVQSVIPVPAAVWLFGSALGLLGLARRKLAA